MRAALSKAVLTISIDLADQLVDGGRGGSAPCEAITDRLLEILARHRLPATWAVSDPTTSPAPVERTPGSSGTSAAWTS